MIHTPGSIHAHLGYSIIIITICLVNIVIMII